MLPLLEGHADFSGVHGAGGKSLMHFASKPVVARWLIEHGEPCDVPDNDGNLPGDILPAAVAAMVNQHLLGNTLKPANKTPSSNLRL